MQKTSKLYTVYSDLIPFSMLVSFVLDFYYSIITVFYYSNPFFLIEKINIVLMKKKINFWPKAFFLILSVCNAEVTEQIAHYGFFKWFSTIFFKLS